MRCLHFLLGVAASIPAPIALNYGSNICFLRARVMIVWSIAAARLVPSVKNTRNSKAVDLICPSVTLFFHLSFLKN